MGKSVPQFIILLNKKVENKSMKLCIMEIMFNN